MWIGILSDTHGSVNRTRAAADILNGQGVKAVIHCGDIGSEAVLVELAAAFEPEQVPVYAVLGNVDLYDDALPAFPESSGVSVMGRHADLTLAGKRCAVVHGDDFRKLDAVVDSNEFTYVFTGHTHAAEDRRAGSTRIINPGAVYRAAEPSCATLDLATDALQHLSLPR